MTSIDSVTTRLTLSVCGWALADLSSKVKTGRFKVQMKKFITLIAVLVATALSACGGGGSSASGGSADEIGNQVTNFDATKYVVSTLALNSALDSPFGISVDAQGDLYIADTGANLIRKISGLGNSQASVTTVLGILNRTGTDYFECLRSNLYSPYGVAVDSAGHIYVAESEQDNIRFADCLTSPGRSNEYGIEIALSKPKGIALKGSNLYVADTNAQKIRLITNNGIGSGVITPLAGTSKGYVNAASLSAAFSEPTGIAVDSSGNVFVADSGNCAIRKISTVGVVSTFAGASPNSGVGACGYGDGTATAARFNRPTGIAIDASNDLFVADTVNNKIRRITPQGVVTTLAGTGASGSNSGLSSTATFNAPTGIAVNSSGNIFVVDSGSKNIRKISVAP